MIMARRIETERAVGVWRREGAPGKSGEDEERMRIGFVL
jgi:hypothetical protein